MLNGILVFFSKSFKNALSTNKIIPIKLFANDYKNLDRIINTI